MSAEDRARWNGRYREAEISPAPSVPAGLVDVVELLPTTGRALDVACGAGAGSVWLALRGLVVEGIDASDVAVGQATRLAALHSVGDRCRFGLADLDAGLPAGPHVDLVMCHLFSAPSLDAAMVERLRPAGVFAITVLSEVDGEVGPFRAAPGELLRRFGRVERLEVVHHHEGDGVATLIGRAAGPQAQRRLD